MTTFPFAIITPDGEIFRGDVESIVAPGQLGSLGVLARHAPMITALTKGILKIKDKAGERFFMLDSGVLEVDIQGNTVALIDTAMTCASADEAKRRLASANQRID